ncbi:hypothetical protein HanRHA438_Chr02g0063161 [Helianthus annuus]|nr:hypothetical protein HanRHA438_Chr02g0063161 [Helianthus annuus]
MFMFCIVIWITPLLQSVDSFISSQRNSLKLLSFQATYMVFVVTISKSSG